MGVGTPRRPLLLACGADVNGLSCGIVLPRSDKNYAFLKAFSRVLEAVRRSRVSLVLLGSPGATRAAHTRAGRLVFAGPVLAIAAGWRRARMESSPKRSERSASDAAASSTSLAQDGIESGEGELSDSPAGPAEEVGASRRGAASLRERNLHAFEEAHFPPYPADPPAEAPFALPACYLDPDAPVSAHKWCARARRSCARLCCCQAHAPALLRSALALRDSPAPGVPPSLPSSQAALTGPRRSGG